MAELTPPPPLNLVFPSPWVIDHRILHILNMCVQPNGTLTPANAAQEIDKLKYEKPASFIWAMWGVVICVAEQTPWKHPGQTTLVKL